MYFVEESKAVHGMHKHCYESIPTEYKQITASTSIQVRRANTVSKRKTHYKYLIESVINYKLVNRFVLEVIHKKNLAIIQDRFGSVKKSQFTRVPLANIIEHIVELLHVYFSYQDFVLLEYDPDFDVYDLVIVNKDYTEPDWIELNDLDKLQVTSFR